MFPLFSWANLNWFLSCIQRTQAKEEGRKEKISFFKRDFIHLFMRDRERGRDIGRGRSRLHARSQMWDSIPDPRIMTWAEGRHPTAEPSRCPSIGKLFQDEKDLVISITLNYYPSPCHKYVLFKKDFIYLFMRDRERGRDTGRGRSRLPAGGTMWDLIRALGSCSEPKAKAHPLSPLGVPQYCYI